MLRIRSGSCLYVRGEGLHLLGFSYCLPLFITYIHGITLSIDAVDSVLMLRVTPAKSAFSTDRKTTVSLAEASTVGPAQNLIKISLSTVRQCSVAVPIKEALLHFAAYATGSASKERLLNGPVDNRLLRGSFSGWPLPELDEHVFQQH